MDIERPDLSQVDPAVLTYIEALEAELERLRPHRRGVTSLSSSSSEFSEPPTTLNVITVSQNLAKRTPRHLYPRQRRGGMGIFDLEAPTDDPPAILTIADESQDLLLITNQARLFRTPARQLSETPVRGRGQSATADLPLNEDEQPALILPHQRSGYLVIVTEQGQVRRQRHHFFGDMMSPGNLLYDFKTMGPPAAACWTSGEHELFIATRQGRAIRFTEQKVPFKGCLGMRLSDDDAIAAVTEVKADGGVFLLTADGKGTIRLMTGFSPNKSPGAGGKIALKTDNLIDAVAVDESDDIFIISRLSKIIRFQAAEVPAKEGVVQGVICMALRADETVGLVKSELT
jgi:DNA gyrase subunit A